MRNGSSQERRQPLPRVDCSAAKLPVLLSLPLQEPLQGTLTDLSRDGIGVTLTEALSPDFSALTQVVVSLGEELLSKCPARIAHITSRTEGSECTTQHLGLQFLIDSEQPLSKLTFSHTDSDWDLIDDNADVQDLFDDFLTHGTGSEVRLHRQREMMVGRLLDHGQEAEYKQLRIAVQREVAPLAKGKPVVVTFERYGCTYLFHAEIKRQQGMEIVFALPRAAIRLLRRRTSRLYGAIRSDFSLDLVHPLRRERVCGLPVVEINEQGCLTRLPSTFPIYPIYLSRIPLRLCWGHPPSGGDTSSMPEREDGGSRPSVNLLASVCSARTEEDGGYLVGLAFNFPEEEGRRLLTAELIHRRRPLIDIVYRDTDHPKIWQLLDESKYLDEKNRESFKPMVEITKDVWAKLQKGRDVISRKILIRRGSEVVGHLQMDRAYPDTWMVHHLAIHPSISKIVAGEMYSTVTDFLSGMGIRYLLSSTRADKAWNKKNYYDFISKYPYPEHHHLEEKFVYEATDLASTSFSENVVHVSSTYELRTIARCFSLQYPPLVCRAFNLEEEHLQLAAHNQLFSMYGLYRSREFLLFKKDRKILAFAMLDKSTSGINVFNLLDKFEIFFMPGISSDIDLIEKQLIAAAIAHFHELGKKGVLYATRKNLGKRTASLGLRFIAAEIVWIADCTASKRYHAFTQTMYGRLIARRRSNLRHDPAQ